MQLNSDSRIIVWGCGTTTAARIQWLNKKFEIVAIVKNDDNAPNMAYDIPIIKGNDIEDFNYDYILICAISKYVEDIRHDIQKLGVEDDRILLLENVEKDETGKDIYLEDIVDRQIKVLKEILNATEDEITDFNWMLERVLNYGIFPFGYAWCSDDKTNYNLYGLQQIPEEFADFCISISNVRVRIAMEIGVYRGRSSYFISAILSRKNPGLKYFMVDIEDRLDNFDRYHGVLPCLEKHIPSQSSDYKRKEYDFVFIDADHSYDGSIADYYNVGQYSKVMTAFHDIYAHEYDGENGGTVRMWKEVMEMTQGKHHRIFSVYPEKWMGIGVVFKN